ncbi:hypothetical protein MHYP_G00260660 [Metynnis hypsauchen]
METGPLKSLPAPASRGHVRQCVCVTVERESHAALRTSSACPASQTKREDDTSPRPGLARFFCGARRSRRACFRRERRASVPGLGVYRYIRDAQTLRHRRGEP